MNTKTKIDGNEQDSVCGTSTKVFRYCDGAVSVHDGEQKVVCDEGITAIQSECQVSHRQYTMGNTEREHM